MHMQVVFFVGMNVSVRSAIRVHMKMGMGLITESLFQAPGKICQTESNEKPGGNIAPETLDEFKAMNTDANCDANKT
jgi:hypothetical protein